MTQARSHARSRSAAFLTIALAACCLSPAREGEDGGAGPEAGAVEPEGGPDAGFAVDGGDAGGVDGGRPTDAGPDGGGVPDSGPPPPWTGFGGSCKTLVAPLAWYPDGGALCPLPDGGALWVDLLLDSDNCGTCGLKCGRLSRCLGGGYCEDDSYACAAELPDGSVVLEQTGLGDVAHCGGCDCPCSAGQQCLDLDTADETLPRTPWGVSLPWAACAIECGPNSGGSQNYPCLLPDGGRLCTNLVWGDSLNCGACGVACASGEQCISGGCRPCSATFPCDAGG